jgi:uncharacterized SAM-binding protein YcdF (DUF218 family)
MSWFITNFIASLLLPPLSLLLLLALGIFLLYRNHKYAKPLILGSFGLLWIASTPFFAEGSLHLLEAGTIALDSEHQDADAIVILGGGTYFHAPEYAGQDTIIDQTLPRLRYGAKLHRADGTPILVTGGKPLDNDLAEAQLMRTSLLLDFHVPVRWTEDASDNTLENARNSFQILQKEGIYKICLVTQAWHMPRAAMAFRHVGFEVVEAPVAFTTRYKTGLLTFLPRAEALRDSKFFVHEVIGLLWYGVRFVFSDN